MMRRGLLLPARRLHGRASLPASWVEKASKELKRPPAVVNRHGEDVKPIYTREDVPNLKCGLFLLFSFSFFLCVFFSFFLRALPFCLSSSR